MKKVITTVAALALLAASGNQALAGDREWATAGKVLTGVIAGSIIARAFEPAPVYHQTVTYAPAPVYVSAPPVYVQPQPVYVQPAPVYVQPAPVVVYQQPVVVRHYAPPPVVYMPAYRPHYYGAPVVHYYSGPRRAYGYGYGCR